MRRPAELPPDVVHEVATILARGYLKYRRSLAIPGADKQLDTSADQSLNVHAVNAAGEEN